MKKVAILTMTAFILIITLAFATDPAKSDAENYDWLIDEVETLYEEEVSIDEIKTMVFMYDAEGNEVVSFEESAYDTLPKNTKWNMDKSEFLFESLGDKVYLITE